MQVQPFCICLIFYTELSLSSFWWLGTPCGRQQNNTRSLGLIEDLGKTQPGLPALLLDSLR